MTTASAATACARTNGFAARSPQPAHGTVSSQPARSTVSHSSTVSPPVLDLSPLNIPVSSHHNLPPSPLMVPTPPLLGHSSFHPAFPAPSAKLSNIPFLGGSSSSLSSSSSAYSTLPSSSSSSAASSLHYPTNSMFRHSPYNDNDAMLDFLTLMTGLSDFPQISIPPNAFDYLYQTNTTTNSSPRAAAASLDFGGLDSVLRDSPSPTI